jgi:hypothetical protein
MSHANRHQPHATPAAARSPADVPTTGSPSHNDISLAAFLQWQAHGGDARHNWLQSEQRLCAARSSPAAAPTAKLATAR